LCCIQGVIPVENIKKVEVTFAPRLLSIHVISTGAEVYRLPFPLQRAPHGLCSLPPPFSPTTGSSRLFELLTESSLLGEAWVAVDPRPSRPN
jgi:hypothetical protein